MDHWVEVITQRKPNQSFDDRVGVLGKPAVSRGLSPKGPGKYNTREKVGDGGEPERNLKRRGKWGDAQQGVQSCEERKSNATGKRVPPRIDSETLVPVQYMILAVKLSDKEQKGQQFGPLVRKVGRHTSEPK